MGYICTYILNLYICVLYMYFLHPFKSTKKYTKKRGLWQNYDKTKFAGYTNAFINTFTPESQNFLDPGLA